MGNSGYYFINEIKNIYSRLGDDLSEYIFSQRLLYSLTGASSYIENVVSTVPEGQAFLEVLRKPGDKVIFGAGNWGGNIAQIYRQYGIKCFVDNRITISGVESKYGLPLISFNDYLLNYRDAVVLVCSLFSHKEIINQLRANGIDGSLIINVGKMIYDMNGRQYFDFEPMHEGYVEDEVFIDAGAFDGRTSLQFVKWCGGEYKKIYAFEPEPSNINLCRKTLDEVSAKYEIIPKGLWKDDTELAFVTGAKGASHIKSIERTNALGGGREVVQVVSLDRVLGDEIVSFIKMDIEGAEHNGLLGAEKQIRANRPKLAISIYHKPEDMWDLPGLILSFQPDYKLYLRHYSIAASETVLYAI